MAPHATALVGVGFAVVAIVLEIVSEATPQWIGTSDGYLGLWKVCASIPPAVDPICVDYSSVEDWVNAVRAFSIIAILSLAACVLSFAATLVRNDVTAIHYLPAALAGVAGVCGCVAFAVFAAKTRDLITNNLDYRYSFYLTVVASAVSVLASIFFALAAKRRSSYSVLP